MSVNFLTFFNLNENFTASELFSSYNNKMVEIDSLNISLVDKEFYKQNINAMYSQAKTHLESKNSLSTIDNRLNNVDIGIDNRLNNVDIAIDNAFSYINSFLSNINSFKNNWLSSDIENTYLQSNRSSYKEELNPDNSITVYEEIITNNNGQINKTIKSYIKYRDGRIENL